MTLDLSPSIEVTICLCPSSFSTAKQIDMGGSGGVRVLGIRWCKERNLAALVAGKKGRGWWAGYVGTDARRPRASKVGLGDIGEATEKGRYFVIKVIIIRLRDGG